MADTEIQTAWPKHIVKPCDTRDPVNIHNTYLISVQDLVQQITFVVVQIYWMIIDVASIHEEYLN